MLRLIACLILVACLAQPAGAESDRRPVDRFTLAEAADYSKQIERELAQRGAYVALVFRSGRPRADLPDGIRYTHGAFWVYGPIETVDGETVYGYAVYNLYHDEEDTGRSRLVQDWPLDFTRGDAVGQAGVIVPTPQMQVRVLDVIASDTYDALHQPAYSLLSNPTDLRFQNCTEFLLDVVASAAWLRSDRMQIKVNLAAYFSPTELRIGWWQRLTARWFDRRIRFDDHEGPVHIATFTSIADFMEAFSLADEIFEVEARFPGDEPPSP
jgi:hypothetical protein